jgi:uncharacterized protein YqjF (DUF2071 family)
LLTARWEHLVMLNFEIAPETLAPLLPAGTALDLWQGRALVSVVGFRFLETRVAGVAIPFHRDFEEVNLRFYVTRTVGGETRRGVVFAREIVPLPLIALTARIAYDEPYVALPMRHALVRAPGPQHTLASVRYGWRWRGAWLGVGAEVIGPPRALEPNSEAEFITEHYWGYSRRRDGSTFEYRVEHPAWRVWSAREARLEGDVGAFYGGAFARALAAPPRSAFVAEGSEVIVRRGVRLSAHR